MATAPKLARNREMFELRSEGWSLAQLSDRYEITVAAVSLALKDYREKHIPESQKEDMRARISQIYDENLGALYRIAKAGPIPAYSNGRPVVVTEADDEAGTPAVYADDWGGVLKARDAIVKVTQEMRKMYGLDEATKTDVSGKVTYEVVGVDLDSLR